MAEIDFESEKFQKLSPLEKIIILEERKRKIEARIEKILYGGNLQGKKEDSEEREFSINPLQK